MSIYFLFCWFYSFPPFLSQGLALGTRHILAVAAERGLHVQTIFVCGGGSRNALLLQVWVLV